MLKKSIFAGSALMLLLGLFFGRDALSYVSTTASRVHQSVKDSVPVEFEIERARDMIKNLDPEIRRNMHLIAKEEVEVERLLKQIEKADKRLAKDRNDIFRLKDDLDSGSETFVYAGRNYSSTQVKDDLSNRFTRYQTNEATTDKLHKIFDARQRGLEAARNKLEGMLAAKRQLEVDVENLEARQKMVEVAQTTSDFNFDDSQLSRTKELIRDIQARIEVGEKLVNASINFHDEIPLDDLEANEDVSKKVAEYFNQAQPGIENIVDLE